MYAVFRSGGKQYRAVKGDVLRLEKIEADEGASIEFDEVLEKALIAKEGIELFKS